jgi:hypothetical protein
MKNNGGIMQKHGIFTAHLGSSLRSELSDKNYIVHYDHGPSGTPGIGAISAYYGKEKHRETKLADLDIAILNPDKQVILLIEIEESDDRPKTILGDAMAVLMADGIDCKDGPLEKIGEWTTLLIISKGSGEKHEQRRRVIEERLDTIRSGAQPGKIRLGAVKVRLFEEESELRGIVGEYLDSADGD